MAKALMFCFLIVLVIYSGCEQIDRSTEETEFLLYHGVEPWEDVWEIWSRDDMVSVTLAPETRSGERSVKVEYPDKEPWGYQDWTLENYDPLVNVEPGEEWTASAYLDGKTPSLVAARGTYTVNKLKTYQYRDGQLDKLWEWDSTEEPGGLYYGQGDHFIHTTDVTGDGRDEIILGASVINSNGTGLWSSGLGHPDNVWVGNIDPTRPGLEIYLGIEGGRVKGSIQNGISLWDAVTGEMLWGLDERTSHIHGSGLVSNIDPENFGMETYSGESSHSDQWLHTAKGELIADETKWDIGLSPGAVYWDSSHEREILVRNRIMKYPDQLLTDEIEGRMVAVADLFGDWREEIITSLPGELRIYMSDIPAEDRRITLMQDPLYRSGVAHLGMGYGQPPLTSFFIGKNGYK